LAEFLSDVDPKLLDEGWGFEIAKGVEYGGQTDQSMINHVRNGVFALSRLNEVVPEFGAYELDDSELRQATALFVIHDLHKYRDEETTARTEYDIDEVTAAIASAGLPAELGERLREGR
jgi:CRISPR-associated protein Csc3